MYILSALIAEIALMLLSTTANPAAAPAAGAVKHLNVTATAAKNDKSVIECWQLSAPITVSSQPGTQGSSASFLGDTSNITYNIIPANTNGGAHNAPSPQYAPLFPLGITNHLRDHRISHHTYPTPILIYLR